MKGENGIALNGLHCDLEVEHGKSFAVNSSLFFPLSINNAIYRHGTCKLCWAPERFYGNYNSVSIASLTFDWFLNCNWWRDWNGNYFQIIMITNCVRETLREFGFNELGIELDNKPFFNYTNSQGMVLRFLFMKRDNSKSRNQIRFYVFVLIHTVT